MSDRASARIQVSTEDVEDLRVPARRALLGAAIPALLAELAPGPYGTTAANLALLDGLEWGLAVLVASRRALLGRISADRRSGFASGDLTVEEERFSSLLATYAGASEALAHLGVEQGQLPPEGRHLKIDEYRELLTRPEDKLLEELPRDLAAYLGYYRSRPDPALRPEGEERLRACVTSYLALVARTATRIGDDGDHATALEALREGGLLVGGGIYRGFERGACAGPGEEGELLPVAPEDIVGNAEVLEAGLALARTVAGFDLASGTNPRAVKNPVLFVLGTPGCGKTVTAHAIANTFLALCRRHGIPAHFRIIRRTDWASSYQNRSASELLRIFREEIFDFPGVAGAYWPDIDTAFAAREDPGIRSEEKAVLGTLFGLLDGTLGPKNGKWFLIADANYLSMDRAALSRLTQDPHTAKGPTTPEEFVALLRDKKLAAVRAHIELGEEDWASFGRACVEHGLSGRAVDNMAGRVLQEVERVDLPDAYYGMTLEEKRRFLEGARRSFGAEAMRALLERYVRFEKEAEERSRRERFERRVGEIQEQLAAQVAAVGGGGVES
jgi:hypothetical protein